ncbi:MAG: hypothetical protein NWE96_07485 [Candidatus Bathyarchaeota archaeon]|nr:hypothetical protein [Candidatus Bathyarchaeota archaeon]
MISAQKKKLIIISLILIVTLSFSSEKLGKAESSNLGVQLTISSAVDGKPVNTNYTFSPLDVVYINANVTYSNQAQANVFVTFKASGPANKTNPTTVIRSAVTDQNGIANISFRIPMDNSSNPSIGEWTVLCNAGMLNQTKQVTSKFKVGWTINLESIKLFDSNGTESSSFSRGQTAKVQVEVLKNISEAVNSTVTINVTDSQGAQHNIFTQNKTFNLSQNIVECEFQVSNEYSIGEAKINCHLNSSIQGLNYEHSLSKNFTINDATIPNEPPSNGTKTNHDLALKNGAISNTQITKGEEINITVTAVNKENVTEQSIIRFSYDSNSAGSIAIALEGYQERTVSFLWNTTNVSPSTYQISARIDSVQDENQTGDNEIIIGTVTVTEKPSVTPNLSATSLYIFALFIIGLTTFSLLSFLRWRVHQVAAKPLLPKLQNRQQENKIVETQPEKLTYETTKAIPIKEVNYASVLPLKGSLIEGSIAKTEPTSTGNQGLQITEHSKEPISDKLTEELTQFMLQSTELIPLSAKAIDLSIQKIQVLRKFKANPEVLTKELTQIERVLDLQTKNMENELDILKECIQKIRDLGKIKPNDEIISGDKADK